MFKKKISWKLASGCLAAVIAVAAAFTFAVDAADIKGADSEISTQTAQSEPQQTAAGTMTNYGASQTQKVSFVSKNTDVAMAMYDVNVNDAPAAASTKAAEQTTAEVSTASAASTTKSAAQTTVDMPYIYDGYVPSTYTTTAAATTTTTSAARVIYTTTTAAAAEKTVSAVADATGTLAKPVIAPEKTYDTDYTHPYGSQTKQIKLHWSAVPGAAKYMVYAKNGQYSDWTNVVYTAETECTVSGLNRDTEYAFAVQAIDAGGKTSQLSDAMNIKTARMDYSAAGWQAMCRIVYHEVGGSSGSMWDQPIVYVADCVVNQYVCAKYTNQGNWAKYYSAYPSVESVIYTSGGFMSDAGLTSRGVTYSTVNDRVKKAVWGAAYGITYYNGIANDYNVFYWCASASVQSDSRIAYGFQIPWGYMYIWRQYWG